MPNGGFGCAYCRYYTPGKCHLRDVRITNDHWTVCANVTYLDDGPTGVRQFLGYRSLDTTGVEVTGSIYSITSDNSNYAQVPWLEKSEIFSRMPMKPCVVCNVQEENTKKINWKGQDYYFCSYNHYLDWRQNEINVHGARDVVTPPSVASYFTELQIISENTSAAQREKAQKRVLRMKVWNYMKSSIGWIIFVKIGVLIYHSLFG